MSDSNTLQEFLVSLGYKVDPNSQKKFNDSLKNAVLQANLLAAAIEGTAKIVATGVDSMARNFASLEWSSERTKSSVENLKNFAYGFSQIGGSAAGAGAIVERFAATLRSNSGMGSYLKSLGVSTQGRESVDQVIDLVQKLHKQFQGNNYGVGESIAGQFGIDKESYFQIGNNADSLAKFRKEYDDTQKSLGLNNDEAAKKWRDFMQDMQQTSMVFQTVMEKIFTDMEPKIQAGLEKFNTWLIANEPAIEKAITTVGSAVSDAAEDFHDLAVAVSPVIKQINGLVESITGKSGLTVAIEGLVGAAVLGRLLRMLSLFGGGAVASGGGLMAILAGLLVDPAYPAELNTPEGHQQLAEAHKNAWYHGLWDKTKRALGFGGSPETGGSPTSAGGVSGSSSQLKDGSNTERDQNALESYRFWRGKGLTRQQALGLVGNEQGESDFNPHLQGDYNPAKGKYEAGGSMQWHQDRRDQILNGTGIDVYSKDTTHQQMLEASWWEFNNTWKEGLTAVKAASTPQEAASAAVYHYELPKDKAGAAHTRGVYANRWDGRINDVAGTDPYRYLGGPMAAADKAGPIITQTTHITVNGATDPHATAGAVGKAQGSVNANILRDAKGAVR